MVLIVLPPFLGFAVVLLLIPSPSRMHQSPLGVEYDHSQLGGQRSLIIASVLPGIMVTLAEALTGGLLSMTNSTSRFIQPVAPNPSATSRAKILYACSYRWNAENLCQGEGRISWGSSASNPLLTRAGVRASLPLNLNLSLTLTAKPYILRGSSSSLSASSHPQKT